MYQIDNERFGQFLSDLRKEKSMTQKMMATLYYGMIPAHAGHDVRSKFRCGSYHQE